MSGYLHHVPGRLRIKTPRIRRNEAEAARLRTLLENIDGIVSHEINTLTGSVLIRYSTGEVQAILDALAKHGYFSAAHPGPAPASTESATPKTCEPLGSRVAKMALGIALEKAVETSLGMLIRMAI